MTIKVFFTISNFRSRKTSSGQFDFSFENPPENACRIPKRFCSAIIEKLCVFFEKSLKAFRRRRIQLGQAWWTNFPKVEFFRSKCQIDIKRRCFLKKKIQKSQRTHNMKCSLDDYAENCSPELRKIFGRSEKKPIELQFIILYFPQNVSLELWEVILLSLPKNVWQCLTIFC